MRYTQTWIHLISLALGEPNHDAAPPPHKRGSPQRTCWYHYSLVDLSIQTPQKIENLFEQQTLGTWCHQNTHMVTWRSAQQTCNQHIWIWPFFFISSLRRVHTDNTSILRDAKHQILMLGHLPSKCHHLELHILFSDKPLKVHHMIDYITTYQSIFVYPHSIPIISSLQYIQYTYIPYTHVTSMIHWLPSGNLT